MLATKPRPVCKTGDLCVIACPYNRVLGELCELSCDEPSPWLESEDKNIEIVFRQAPAVK